MVFMASSLGFSGISETMHVRHELKPMHLHPLRQSHYHLTTTALLCAASPIIAHHHSICFFSSLSCSFLHAMLECGWDHDSCICISCTLRAVCQSTRWSWSRTSHLQIPFIHPEKPNDGAFPQSFRGVSWMLFHKSIFGSCFLPLKHSCR